MPITNTIQLVDFQEEPLHAEESAVVIQEKIRQKRITEANRIFKESASDMKKDDRERVSKQLSALVEQAEKYFREADTLETERKLEQAREKYKKVEDIAVDFPKLPEALRRLDDAIALVRALEHRAKRRTSRQDKQPVLLTTSSQTERYRGWLPLLACFSLLLIMVGTRLFYTDNINLTFTEKDTILQVAALEKDEFFTAKDIVTLQTNKIIEQPESQRKKKALPKEEVGKQQDSRKQAGQIATSKVKKNMPPVPNKLIFKNVPTGIEEDRQQKPSDPDTESARKERAVSFTELQLNRKESSSPVPVSLLQMKKKRRYHQC